VETVAAIALLLFLAFVTLAVVATVRTARAVKRGVERGSAQARRVVEDNLLRARRHALPGAAGQLAQLRIDLRQRVDATFAALDARRAEDPSLGEAAGLLARLNDHARALDREMKFLEREPDKSRLAARLPDFAERTRRITHAADSLRWAAQDRARHFADDELASLGRDIELEAGALRHWAPVAPLEDGAVGVPRAEDGAGPAGGAKIGPPGV
jgi:hypothetical protein